MYVGKANIQYGDYCVELLNCMSEASLKEQIAQFGNRRMYNYTEKQLNNYKRSLEHKTKYQFVPMVNLSIKF